MTPLKWLSPVAALAALVAAALAWTRAGRFEREIAEARTSARPEPEAGPDRSDGPSPEAELEALRREIARLREAVGALPAGNGAEFTKEDLRREILAVETERARAAKSAEARRLAKRALEQSLQWLERLAAEQSLDAAQKASVRELLEAHVAGYESAWGLLPSEAGTEPDPVTGAPRPATQVRLAALDAETHRAIGALLPGEARKSWGSKPQRWFDGMVSAPSGDRE